MRINIANAVIGQKYPISIEFALSDFLGTDASGTGTLSAVYWLEGDSAWVEGSVGYKQSLPCARCNKPVDKQICLDICESFGIDEDSYSFSRTELDLTQMLTDLIVLSSPSVVLCSEDCPGLCYICGAELSTNCGCDRTSDPLKDNPFAELARLKKGNN